MCIERDAGTLQMPLNVHLHMYFIDAALWFNFQSRHKRKNSFALY